MSIPTLNNYTTAGIPLTIYAGSFTTFVNQTDGLWVFGDNTQGALGLPTSQIYFSPVKHPFTAFATQGVLKVAGARGQGQHTVIITLLGNVYTMGSNTYGQLGLGSLTNQFAPSLITASVQTGYKALDICAGNDHTMVVYGIRSCPNNCQGTVTDPMGVCNTVLGICNCYAGFLGDACQLYQCTDPKCSGYGTCDTTQGLCVCNTGFEGTICQFRNCPNACSGRGTCQRTTGTCSCQPGYVGIDCSTNGSSLFTLSIVSIFISLLFFF